MASVSDVFKQLKQEAHTLLNEEEVVTPEEYCMLESDTTRKILMPEKYSIFGVESDEKVKTVKFAFPRYVDDGRLNLSDYQIRINYMTANPDTENNKDQVQAQNVHTVGEYIVFEWLLSRRVTQYKGTITFIVCAITAEEDGTITTEWNTTLATSQSIEGLEVSLNENEETQVRDLLTELLSIINVAKEEVIEASEQTQQNKTETENLYNLTRSYAVGDTGTREGEETDNSKYYYTKCKDISDSIPGALKPMGTVAFENLPELSVSSAGDMYNISNEFVTDERFKEGSGSIIPLGSNVYKTTDGFWDVLTGSPVTGIKGENEQTYRRGNVNITKDNIDLGNVPNVATNDQIPTFTIVDEDTALTSGEKLSSILGKLAKTVLSVISLKKDVAGLNGKIMPYIDYEIPGGGSVQINPSTTGFYYLVLLRSSTAVNYAAIILTGYSIGDARYKYKKLDDGNIGAVEVSGQSFIISMDTAYNDETQLRLYVLLGDIPNIV